MVIGAPHHTPIGAGLANKSVLTYNADVPSISGRNSATVSPSVRMSGDDRRLQLIEVAIDLFAQKGFGGTTTKEIAAAAGVTEAIIFRHFATKQDLYQAILDYKCGSEDSGRNSWLAKADELMEAEDDLGFFRFLLTAIIGFHCEFPQFERLLVHAALEGHELGIMHQQQISETVGKRFIAYIGRRQAAGAIRAGDARPVLLSLVGAAKFYAMQKYMFSASELQSCDDGEMIENFLQILMNGLKPL